MSTRIYRNQRGFTLIELMVATAVLLLVVGSALTAFSSAMRVTQSGTQMADANQNLRAGTNTLIRDLMMAGRIIGPEGIPVPTGAGVQAFRRPSPPSTTMTFDLVIDADTTLNLPDITTGQHLGPTVNGEATDMVTIMTVDEFTPVLMTPPNAPASPTSTEGIIDPAAASVTLPLNSVWLVGDVANDTAPIQIGDLVLFKSPSGLAIQTVTRKDATHIYFDNSDWFRFNQRGAPIVPVLQMKLPADTTSAWTQRVTLFRALMITYYVDNVTTAGSPRLTRVVNNFAPQALAGVVEDLELTYDLVDGVNNPVNVGALPWTSGGVTYNSNQIRKANLHVGVRSESMSPVMKDYVRNHISTAVDIRSLASVDRYVQ